MKTSVGSPDPYTWYWTCTPSGAMAMRGAPSAGAEFAAGAAVAVAGGGASSFLPQPDRASTAPSASQEFRMAPTLRERRDVVTDRQRRGEARAFDAEQVHESGHAVIGLALDAEVGLRLAG